MQWTEEEDGGFESRRQSKKGDGKYRKLDEDSGKKLTYQMARDRDDDSKLELHSAVEE